MVNKGCNKSWIRAKGFTSSCTRSWTGDGDPSSQHCCCYMGQTWQSLAARAELSAAGQGRSWESDTALIYTAALSPKASEGSSLYRNPTKTQTQPIPQPRNCTTEPSVPGKKLRGTGIAAGRGKTSGSCTRCSAGCLSPGDATAAKCCPQVRCTGRASVPLLQCPLHFLVVPGRGARPGAVTGAHPPLSSTGMEQL